MVYRRTLRREVACTGIGLHSGEPVRLRLLPAPAEHGIRFVRTDVGVEIPATLAHIGAPGPRDDAAARTGSRSAPSSTCSRRSCGLGRRRRARRGGRPRGPGPRRQRRALRDPAARGGPAAPRRAAPATCKVTQPVEVVHGAKSARLVPRRPLRGQLHDRLRPPAAAPPGAARCASRRAASPRRSPPRARSASCARWRCCARAASPSAAASRTRW